MSSPVDFPFDVALVLRVGGDVVASWGDVSRARPLASVTKPIVAWSALVAVSQGALALDSPGGPEGATLRHLLAHASGLPLDSREPVAAPGKRRIYSNAGFDVIGGMVEEATGMPLRHWVARSVFGPLGMASADVPGSPAHSGVCGAADLSLFAAELTRPSLVPADLGAEAAAVQFPALAGVVPGYGRHSPCQWGLGVEIRGEKSPHWTAPTASPATFGHFGQSGSFVWVDRARAASAVFLGDRPFGQWHKDNWPALNERLLSMVDGLTDCPGAR